MGRDVTGLHIDKKPNAVNAKTNGTVRSPAVHVAPKKPNAVNAKTNGTVRSPAVHVAPRVTPEKVETKDYEPDNEVQNEKLDVLGVKSTNQEEPEEKVIRAEVQKSTDKKSTPVKPESGSAASDANSVEQTTPTEKQTLNSDHVNGVETNDSALKCSPKSNELSPETVIKHPNSPLMSRKQLQINDKLYHDEEDNWSLASSTATSRTLRSKVTVPVAPRFTCTDRLQRRKDFYTKLEEKHKALEKERLEYEARTKDEEQAAIKQLRKNMVVKAKPVPSFYREGPPPKVELKKLPVTRAKSPNLSRRKSCGDAVKSTPEEKGSCARAPRHSVGIYKEGKNSPITPKSTPISKERVGARKLNGSNKSEDRVKERTEKVVEATENSQVKAEGSTDISVES